MTVDLTHFWKQMCTRGFKTYKLVDEETGYELNWYEALRYQGLSDKAIKQALGKYCAYGSVMECPYIAKFIDYLELVNKEDIAVKVTYKHPDTCKSYTDIVDYTFEGEHFKLETPDEVKFSYDCFLKGCQTFGTYENYKQSLIADEE